MDDRSASEAARARPHSSDGHFALDASLEIWFRIALRDLARIAADDARFADAAQLLTASRRNMAVWGLDPAVYGPVEERCRAARGDDEFDRLAVRGDAMSHDELVILAGASTTAAYASG